MSQGPKATTPPLDELELLEPPEELEELELLLGRPPSTAPLELAGPPELLLELAGPPELLLELAGPPELLVEPVGDPELLPLSGPPLLLPLTMPVPPELLVPPEPPSPEPGEENDPHATATSDTATDTGKANRIFFMATSPVAWVAR
jgi:hypothetical protein